MNIIIKISALMLALLLTVSIVSCVSNTSENTEPIQTEYEKPHVKQHVHTFINEQCKDAPCTVCGESVDPTHEYILVLETKENLYECATSSYKCKNCDAKKTVNTFAPISPDKLDIPVVYFTGSLDGISKENELVLEVKYKSDTVKFSSYAKMKIQGNTSQLLPKKNFTVKFYEDRACTDKNKVDLGWGKEYKYCMKANYLDASQARNVVAARIYSQIVAERTNDNDKLATLAANYGVIDGYPVLMYLNGEFYGLYTMNIPKDKWMMGMKDSEKQKQAILMSGGLTNSCALKEPIPTDIPEESGWDLEYCSTEDTAWVTDSFNRFIYFLANSSDAEFKDGISSYIDVDAAIDVLVYGYFICGWDNAMNNFLWITYDGDIWIPTVYDLDNTYRTRFSIDFMLPQLSEDGTLLADNVVPYNLLWHKLLSNYSSEIKLRYYELRAGILATQNIEKAFSDFFSMIPDVAYVSDAARWTDMPYTTIDHYDQIMTFVEERAAILYGIFSKVNS